MATPNTSGSINRITKEIANIQKGSDISLAVAFRDSDVRHTRALIVGPPETPYEYGFFEFDITFTKEYPIKSPQVKCVTTNGGKSRFNPNIYADGKVCLSILGTWRGERGEEWSSAQGLESILLSIQSLMSSNPYENEPGYERSKKEEVEPKAYVAKIRHETLRIAVLQKLEQILGIEDQSNLTRSSESRYHSPYSSTNPNEGANHSNGGTSTPDTDSSTHEYDAEATYNALAAHNWDPLAPLLKIRFLWYYDTYASTVAAHSKDQRDGSRFATMPFEFETNMMAGKFEYNGISKRLKKVLEALNTETAVWASRGAELVNESTQLATQIAFQFKQLQYTWNERQYPGTRMEITLPDPQNPFVWNLTLFGPPSGNLEGGIFNMTITIPPDFPDSQPRVKVDTPIFHRQVNSIGAMCYFPSRPDELASHLEAIVATFEDANPVYDPRAVVNPEAFALYWGGEEKRKIYNRRLRRSAQESTEF